MTQPSSSKRQSKRHYSRPNGQKWLWFGGIAAMTVLALLVVTTQMLKRSSSAAPQTTATPISQTPITAQVSGAPRLSVVQDTFDYGTVPLGNTINTVFRLDNVGDQPLTILNQPKVRVIEGCCPPNAVLSSSVIQPGDEATISLSFSMMVMDGSSMAGKHRFNIDVQTNDPTQPDKQLVVLSNWK